MKRRLLIPLILLGTVAAAPPAGDNWVSAWLSPPIGPISLKAGTAPAIFSAQTVRQVIRVETDGTRLRLRLTNELGRTPVRIGTVRIALLDDSKAIVASSSRDVTFGGKPGAFIPTGAPLLSDPIDMPVKALQHLAISVYYGPTTMPAAHLADVTVAPGDQGAAPVMQGAESVRAVPAIVSAIDVVRERRAPVIVAFGDSITEGARSTPGANMSWPQQFSARIAADPARKGWSVVNAGISGNRLLREGTGMPALARFDRDALAVPGVTHVVLLEGINDIGGWNRPDSDVNAADIIAAYRQLIDRAHAKGVKIIGATILPYKGAAYFTPEGEGMRQEVNRFIRIGGAFDGVIDFEKATADPADPAQLNPTFDPGDHLHPNDAGYGAMAAAVQPSLFEDRKR